MNRKTQKGMTLIELILAIVVVGIIGAVASTKFTSSSSLTIGQQSDQFANQIRYAQSLAQNWGCQLTVFVTATSYEVRNRNIVTGKTQCSVANGVITNPSTGKTFSVSLNYGVQFAVANSFDFNIKGAPTNSVGTLLSAATVFNLTGSGSTYVISVSNITGHVSVSGP